jgi:hypothetical protein
MGNNEIMRSDGLLFRITSVLLALTLLTVWGVSGVSAKFVSGNSDQSTAGVASFDITDEGTWSQGLTVRVSPDALNAYTTIIVKNHSEVAVNYTVTVKNETENITPLKLTMQKAVGEEDAESAKTSGKLVKVDSDLTKGTDSESDTVYTFTDSAAPNEDTTNTYFLNFRWSSNPAEEDPNLEYMGMVDYFTITVTAEQAD